MKQKHIFVTVGTTQFEKLIAAISEEDIIKSLEKLGYSSIQFQTGNGTYVETSHPVIDISYNKYFSDFQEQIDRSDLVISHAGAGSCLEVLKSKKPLIVVINEDLMDNHQTELAKHLSEKGYLYYCTCDTLKETLEKDFNLLKPYPVSDGNIFADYLDQCMGFQ
ncbi:hypothetical protein WA026_007671 [Henosepilachna vigintioctopunctata]|uniref:UDP-N-acetylglucosamine transferase subunit ALG13 n=1 Tax=Henosepilachna vigintioctopunctata TaxID=420089 RepID=A0AAW1U7L2_9CUCU